MSTYVISDIRGCFDEFQTMLDRIGLTEVDRLILAGHTPAIIEDMPFYIPKQKNKAPYSAGKDIYRKEDP